MEKTHQLKDQTVFSTWMSQEVSKRLVNCGHSPLTNHLLTSWDIQAASPPGSLITLCTPKMKTRQTPRKASVTDTRAKDWVVEDLEGETCIYITSLYIYLFYIDRIYIYM